MASVAHFGRVLESQKLQPIIRINRRIADLFLSRSEAVGEITDRMVQILNNYPHFFVLRGPPPIETPDLTINIARAIARRSQHPFIESPERLGHVSQTRIEIEPNAQLSTAVTRYSRTNRALMLHTDSSYDAVPHELVAFQMVRPDFQGGHTIVGPVEDILSGLDEQTIIALHKTKVPFGRGLHPILWRHRGAQHIRFYDHQILNAIKSGAFVDETTKKVLRAVLDVLKDTARFQTFPLGAGDTLFMHNTRALHGRTGFAPDSRRLMLRVRVYAGCLA